MIGLTLHMRPDGAPDIYKKTPSNSSRHAFFSRAHETISRIDFTLGHKTSLNKLKKIKITSSIFFLTTMV